MSNFYCVLYDNDKKIFDVFGPVSDDTLFVETVNNLQDKGLNVSCSTVMASDVCSIEDLKRDGNPPGYRYHAGLIRELNAVHN